MAKNRNSRSPKKKTPKTRVATPAAKKPVQREQTSSHRIPIAAPVEVEQETMVWRFQRVDSSEGPWSWNAMSHEDRHLLEGKMKSWETQTAAAFFVGSKKGHHCIPIERLCPEAQRRLQELQLDDQDELWGLRVTAKKRAWGFRRAHIFYFLWWDPEHTVYPVKKKHT